MCLMLPLFYLSPGSVNGQGQKTEVKVLKRGNDWDCPSKEEREQIRNQIKMITSQVIASVCNGTPGWRRVAFINMTNNSYNCPSGLNLTSHSKRVCGRSHPAITGGCSATLFSVGDLPYSRVCGRIRGYQLSQLVHFVTV